MTGAVVGAVLVAVLAVQNQRLRAQVAEWRYRATFLHRGFVVPSFHAVTLDGRSVIIGETRPGGRQVLFLFDTRCPFCLETLPIWNRIATSLAARADAGLDVYGISADTEAETRAYVSAHDVQFPVVLFPDPRFSQLYRVRGVPVTAVFNGEGTVL